MAKGQSGAVARMGKRLPAMPSFDAFYLAVNGRQPFPWQARLASWVEEHERWPREVGVPTGLGKTACLDIAVWWLASQADRDAARRSATTRIWWVVNRRLLVDSTAEHARAVADALADPASVGNGARSVLAAVAERLRSLAADPAGRPLGVVSLRGGMSCGMALDPSKPTVLLATLPMYGSRLLFRGYGSMRPAVDAGMAGTDSLVLLDEAHLAPHLRTLVTAVAECTPRASDILGPYRSWPRVTSLTATGDAPSDERFDLDGDDESNEVVRQRLDAAKPTEVRVGRGDAGRHLADAALYLVRDAGRRASCLVFANTPATAREAFSRLAGALEDTAEVHLLTGLNREREAARIRANILDPDHGMPSSRCAGRARDKHLIVVATQTLEVGADIDAELLVTEACGVRALTQRLGRLNRLGRTADARAVYVHVPPARQAGQRGASGWPVYREEPEAVLERLEAACAGETGRVDLSPRAVADVLGSPRDDPGRAPEVLPGILWEWAKTTTRPEGEAPVEPYFSGIGQARRTASLIWRAHVPGAGRRLWPRPTDAEAMDVPLAQVREALGDAEVAVLDADGVTVERVAGAALRPGARVLLASDAGFMDAFGWNPGADGSVPDVSLQERGLPLDRGAILRLCGVDVGDLADTAQGLAEDDGDVDAEERSRAAAEIIESVRSAAVPAGWAAPEWGRFTASLTERIQEARLEVARLVARDSSPEPAHGDDFDELSIGDVAVELHEHGNAVGERAMAVAARMGLPREIVEVVERAARLHDLGKADPRFQRWLDPQGSATVPVAKSDVPRHRWEATRVASGWPRGGRHEDLSARLVQAWLASTDWGSTLERDLLVHLVISHHGKGRPIVRPVDDPGGGRAAATIEGVDVDADADLSVTDWAQPARFRRLHEHFGPWGLALLEAVVVRADHAVSAGARMIREEGFS